MTIYRDIYTRPFVSALGENWSVSVMRRDWKKLSQVVKASIEPFGVDFPEVKDEEKVKNIFDPIRGAAYDLEFVADEKFSLKKDLYTEDARKFLVTEYKEGTENFKGYLNPYLSEEPYGNAPYYMKVGATCGLRELANKKFVDPANFGYYKNMSVIQALIACLARTDLNLEVIIACDTYGMNHDQSKDALSQVLIQPLRFVGNDDEPYDCQTVLAAICDAYTIIVFQQNARWYIVQPHLFAGNEMVRHFRYSADGKLLNESLLNPRKVICEPGSNSRIKILKDNPTTSYNPSLRKIIVDSDYGPLANRLVNGRFRDVYKNIQGVERATGWYFYRADTEFQTPNPQKYWNSKKLILKGQANQKDSTNGVGVFSDFFGDGSLLAFYQQDKPHQYAEKSLVQSNPFVVKAGERVELSGSFLNHNCRGSLIQVMALPLRNLDLVNQLKVDPQQKVYVRDVLMNSAIALDADGTWKESQAFTSIVFENTVEVDVNGTLVVKASSESSSISITSESIPYYKWPFATQSSDGKYKFNKDSNIVYYLIVLFLYRGVPYEEHAPKNPGPPAVEYFDFSMGVRKALDLDDIRSERLTVEQNKTIGKEWKDVKLQVGTVGGEQYYSQLLASDGSAVTRFTRRGKNDNFSLAHIAAMTWLSQYRKSTLIYRLGVRGKGVEMGSTYQLENKPTIYHVIGANFNRRSNTSNLTLTELLSGTVTHTFIRSNVTDKGKVIPVENGTIEGDIVENEGDLFFTFFEPNGKSGNKIGITGSVWSAYPNSTLQLPAHYFTVAWNNNLQDGPYEVIVESFLHGQGLGDYQKIYETSDMFATVEVSGDTIQSLKIRVRTASGQEIQRPAIVTTQQELQLADVGRSCVGDFPAVSAVLKNSKPPVIVKIPLSTRVSNLSPALYYAEVVNLATGEVVFTTAKGSVIPNQNTLGIVVQMPEEWNSGLYGFRIIDGSFGADRCGIITEITRCKAKPPLRFNHEFTPEFYQEEVPG